MYEPPHFRSEDREAAFGVIRSHPLGVLISGGAGGLCANPIPFLLAETAHGVDVLHAHLARANPQWREIADAPDVLVVFQGMDHYIAPGWYATKQESGKVVPTWNYVHVQVRGRARIDESAAFLRPQVEALTRQQESGRAAPWAVGDAPEAFIQAQMRGIVGIEIEIASLRAKFKLSQNRNMADQAGVVAGLSTEQDKDGPVMAIEIARMAGETNR